MTLDEIQALAETEELIRAENPNDPAYYLDGWIAGIDEHNEKARIEWINDNDLTMFGHIIVPFEKIYYIPYHEYEAIQRIKSG